MGIAKNNKGLTLIETVIALTLVVILTTAFAGAMVTGLKSERTTNNLDKAINLSASTFDFFNQKVERESNFNKIVLGSISLSSNRYQDTLENFESEINNNYFTDNIYNSFSNELNLNLSDSEIIIEKINEDYELYNVKLIILWNSDSGGSYQIESVFGGSYE